MHLFYTSEPVSDTLLLTEEESLHCKKVLRLGMGAELDITDGQGNLYKGVISGQHGKQCQITITQTHTEYGRRNFRVHIGIAPTKI